MYVECLKSSENRVSVFEVIAFSVSEMKDFVSFHLIMEFLLCLFTVYGCGKISFECMVSVLGFLHYILKQIVRRLVTLKGEPFSHKECLSYPLSFEISD